MERRGVTLRVLQELMVGENDQDRSKMPVDAVVESVIKPATEHVQRPYVEWVQRAQGDAGVPAVGVATVFVSHPWDVKLGDLVSALQGALEDNQLSPETFLWLAMTSLNLHASDHTTPDFLFDLGRVVASTNLSLHVLVPFRAMVCNTRLWCAVELLMAVGNSVPVAHALPKKAKKRLRAELVADIRDLAAGAKRCNLQSAVVESPTDKTELLAFVAREWGFKKATHTVRSQATRWLAEMAVRRVADGLEDNEEAVPILVETSAMLRDQGSLDEALTLANRAMVVQQRLHGPTHRSVAHSLNFLASIQERQGQIEEAVSLYSKALEIREEVHPKTHPNVALALCNLAGALRRFKLSAQADPHARRALDILRLHHGSRHPAVAKALVVHAGILKDGGRFEEAEAALFEARTIFEATLGPQDRHVATVLNSLGMLKSAQRQFGEAEDLFTKASTVFSSQPQCKHVGIALNNLACAQVREDRDSDAVADTLRQAVASVEKEHGEEHPKKHYYEKNLNAYLDFAQAAKEAQSKKGVGK